MNIYLHNGQEQFGPYSEEDVRGWIESGNVTGEFQFFIEGQSTEWSLVEDSFLMPSLSPQEHLELLTKQIQLQLNSLPQKSGSLIGSFFSSERKSIDQYEIMVFFDEWNKEYGPYKLDKAIHYEGLRNASSFRFVNSQEWQHFSMIKEIWSSALASEKQTKKLQKFGLDIGELEITNGFAVEALNKLDKAKYEVSETKPPTQLLKKKMKELGVEHTPGVTRAEARRLIESQAISNKCKYLQINLPENCTNEMAHAIIEKEEEKRKIDEQVASLQARGIQLVLPIRREELDDILENGPPTKKQLLEYDELLKEFEEKLGIEFKPYGKDEVVNHSKESIEFSINMLDEVICNIECWDEDLDNEYIVGEETYDISRSPNQDEWLLIRRELARLTMMEEHVGDDQVIRKILKKFCPEIIIKKEAY